MTETKAYGQKYQIRIHQIILLFSYFKLQHFLPRIFLFWQQYFLWWISNSPYLTKFTLDSYKQNNDIVNKSSASNDPTSIITPFVNNILINKSFPFTDSYKQNNGNDKESTHLSSVLWRSPTSKDLLCTHNTTFLAVIDTFPWIKSQVALKMSGMDVSLFMNDYSSLHSSTTIQLYFFLLMSSVFDLLRQILILVLPMTLLHNSISSFHGHSFLWQLFPCYPFKYLY